MSMTRLELYEAALRRARRDVERTRAKLQEALGRLAEATKMVAELRENPEKGERLAFDDDDAP